MRLAYSRKADLAIERGRKAPQAEEEMLINMTMKLYQDWVTMMTTSAVV